MKTSEWIERVISNIDNADLRRKVQRELEVKIHDLLFSHNEEKVLEKLGDPDIYFKKHYLNNNDKTFFKIAIVVGLLLILLGILSLLAVMSNLELFDHFRRTAFGVSEGPIYFGGLLIGIGIISVFSGMKHK